MQEKKKKKTHTTPWISNPVIEKIKLEMLKRKKPQKSKRKTTETQMSKVEG